MWSGSRWAKTAMRAPSRAAAITTISTSRPGTVGALPGARSYRQDLGRATSLMSIARSALMSIARSAFAEMPHAPLSRGSLCSLASVYLRLGPRVFRHLNFNCRVARFYREPVGVEGVRSEAAQAVTTDPSAIGNEHELSASPPIPVAFGRNEAHQEFVSRLECLLRPAIGEHVSRTSCFHAPGLLF